jgi:hypothetical protein
MLQILAYAAIVEPRGAAGNVRYWPESANSIWALPAYSRLNFSLLSHLQGIIDLDAKDI